MAYDVRCSHYNNFRNCCFLKYFHQTNNSNHRTYENNAPNILNERFARGEISEEEYTRKKSEIKK